MYCIISAEKEGISSLEFLILIKILQPTSVKGREQFGNYFNLAEAKKKKKFELGRSVALNVRKTIIECFYNEKQRSGEESKHIK